MSKAIEKYQKLGIKEALSISYRYPLACKELAVILRLGFSKSPKPLQSLLFQDTLEAFRLLPFVQTQSAISAANLLNQSADAALPKQKRSLAATEFKQAKVAYKRRAKTQKDDNGKDPVQLPQDVLVLLFSFLDMQSLVSAGMVCWSWNAAANDNYLWRFQSNTHFGDSPSILRTEGQQGDSLITGVRQHTASNNVCEDANCNWKEAFRRSYLGLPSWRHNYNRGYCGHCNSVVWLNNLQCPNAHSGQGFEDQHPKFVSPTQIGRYILDDTSCLLYSSDSDSESDDEFGFKFRPYIFEAVLPKKVDASFYLVNYDSDDCWC